jgi:hypothetical protein
MRTIVFERAEHPRYKTCGGGLIGASRPPRAASSACPPAGEINKETLSRLPVLGR